jgi:hypothetical protein
MFLVNTRVDISFVVNTLSLFMVEPMHIHWKVAKHVLISLMGIIHYGMRYVGDGELSHGFVDSNG